VKPCLIRWQRLAFNELEIKNIISERVITDMKRVINIEATPRCFADCSMCPRELIKQFGDMEIGMAIKIGNVLNKIPKDEISEVSIAGRGEPTLHPYFGKYIKSISSKHKLSVVSTLANMNDEIIDSLNQYVSKLRISISSVKKETFLKVHRGLDYKIFWKNFDLLVENFDSQKIIIHLVGGSVIADGLEETILYLKNKGINNIFIFPLWNRGGSKEQTFLDRDYYMNKYDIKASESEYLDLSSNKRHCILGDSSLSINYNGDVTACFQDFAYNNIIGNIQTDSYDLLLNVRKKHLKRMEICKKCNSGNEIKTYKKSLGT
jgi:MoaA/NifB/PqqE/SkfB family radical SAM enzyme